MHGVARALLWCHNSSCRTLGTGASPPPRPNQVDFDPRSKGIHHKDAVLVKRAEDHPMGSMLTKDGGMVIFIGPPLDLDDRNGSDSDGEAPAPAVPAPAALAAVGAAAGAATGVVVGAASGQGAAPPRAKPVPVLAAPAGAGVGVGVGGLGGAPSRGK
jgi:hypothetical protein